jgi:catechol 2,3-dioxygenase-like lactoylglutathione lyase family enzyme
MKSRLELDHVQIAIPKGGEEDGRAFFVELLGLVELPKPREMAVRGGCWFAAADRQIHLGVDADFRAARKAHVALNTTGLDELRARLERAGYVTKEDSDFEGRRRFFTHDPFGNRIEFMDRTARI